MKAKKVVITRESHEVFVIRRPPAAGLMLVCPRSIFSGQGRP